jgi:hypothetical protein
MKRSTHLSALVVSSLAAAVGCSGGPTGLGDSDPPPPPDVRAYVTSAALESLDANGHFQLHPTVPEGPYSMLSAIEATDLAAAVITTWYANPNVRTPPGAVSLAAAAEEDHGGPIDWQSLQPGLRGAYFAESHLQPVPSHLGNPVIRLFGPYFLVPLYEQGVPKVVVAVAAYATNVAVDSRGFVHRLELRDDGNEFRVSGIPRALESVTVPPTPEAAVQFAFEVTGVKIAEVPVLGVPGNRVTPTFARWRIRLGERVVLERLVDGGLVSTDVVYVGVAPAFADVRLHASAVSRAPSLRLFAAASAQPDVERYESLDLPLRSGYAVDLHEVRHRR